MANTKSPVGRIVDAAKRIVDAVTPGEEAGRSSDKRGPIPATAPPGLKRAGDTAKRVATTTARTAKDAASRTVSTAKEAAGATVETARRAADRTTGTARQGAKRAGTKAKTGASRTAKQAKKGAQETAETAREQAGGGEPGPGVPYEKWTKAELYERAQELDISGRSSMNKGELIDALRDHG